jgi:hypothetical protein
VPPAVFFNGPVVDVTNAIEAAVARKHSLLSSAID